MSAPLLAEVHNRLESSPQTELPLAAEGVLRYVWEGRFGPMLIEVRDGRSYVNGQLVEPVAREPDTGEPVPPPSMGDPPTG